MIMRTSYQCYRQILLLCIVVNGLASAFAFAPTTHHHVQTVTTTTRSSVRGLRTVNKAALSSISDNLNAAIEKCQPEFIKTCKVKVGPSPDGHRLGLIATDNMKKGDVAISMAYDDQIVLSPKLASKEVWNGILPAKYDGWSGDNGLLGLLLLNELAKVATNGDAGIQKPKRKPEASALIAAWISSLPSPKEMETGHPFMWSEDNQEALQSSSTKKIYRYLDDLEEDSVWLEERIWEPDRKKFPKTVELNGESYPCFCPEGFSWAVSLVASRGVYVDGSTRLIPILDMANHDDLGTEEVQGGSFGAFGTTKGALIRTGNGKSYKRGDEVFVSYGPKSAAEYLLDHGFLPNVAKSMQTSVAELTFEVDQDDRFYDDKLDILEFETYDSAPMEPVQSFDAVSEASREGEPDPAMIQFLRLLKLTDKDAFLLESIFRQEVWEFMSYPVSEPNERDVLDAVAAMCTKCINDQNDVSQEGEDEEEDSPLGLCAIVRNSEKKALSRTLEFVSREKEALDLKEYYQQRRLKDLGLDSEWNPDETSTGLDPYDDDDLSFGQTRSPGSLDW